jgi:hypothetical protein
LCEWWLSPYINHFTSADTIVPGYSNPQNLNRYSYVTNNPLRYIDPSGHMRVEDGPQSNGCSNPKYCNHGKPKPKEELKKMRNEGIRNKPVLTATVIPIATTTPTPTITPTMDLRPPAVCPSNPCIGNFVPSATSTPQATALPLPQAMSTVVSGAGDIFNTVCMPSLSGTPGCGQVIDQAAQGLGFPPGTGTTIDAILAGASGANEIANNVHISEPTGQGYINGGIYLGVAEVTSLFPLLVFFMLP